MEAHPSQVDRSWEYLPDARARARDEEIAALTAENAALRAGWAEAIALAQYLDQDFGEEGAALFLAAPPERTAWHRAYAAELLEERLAERAALARGTTGAGAGAKPAEASQDAPGALEP